VAVDRDEKAGLLWNSFRERFGLTVPITQSIDFSQFFPHFNGLEEMTRHFSHE
jgi:hypothetical protein